MSELLNKIRMLRADQQLSNAHKELWVARNKKIHSLIDQVSVKYNLDKTKFHNSVKQTLFLRGIIRSSLKELNATQQSELITQLGRSLNE